MRLLRYSACVQNFLRQAALSAPTAAGHSGLAPALAHHVAAYPTTSKYTGDILHNTITHNM